ncbi:MAG: NRDE family protein [Haliea sp.]|uniref:NRDE family protein n=1 Tax=Haliea sp. TaxID=1932666 RepID=UPI0032EFAF83
MCLIVFAWKVRPAFPLLLAANRDEFHRRATAPSGFWPEHPDLLAGRDLEAGGTWMGVTRQGRFAAITNYRDPGRTQPAPRSRGELPLAFLTGTGSPAAFLRGVEERAGDYAGFNLLVGDTAGLWYFSNSTAEHRPRALAPGVYGLSNAQLNTPWPKLARARQRLEPLLDSPSLDHEALRRAVSDRSLADEADLHPLGLRETMDRLLSAQFIVSQDYGTRSTTSLWLQQGGRAGGVTASWEELSFDPWGRETARNSATFSCAAGPQSSGA